MNRFEGIKPSVGKIVLCSILAVVLGVIQPVAVIFQMMLPAPAISLAMIAATAMYGAGGIVPVVVYGIVAALSSMLMYGVAVGAISMLIWLVPAIVIMKGMHGREPFFRQMTKGIISAVAAMAVAAVCLMVIFGSNLIALFIDQIRQNFASQQDLFYQMLSPMFSTEMTFELFVEMYYSSFNTLQVYYEYYLVANLLTGAIASACIAVLWGNWKTAKRGMATAESYCSLSRWYLPANTTWGLLLMLAAGYIVENLDIGAAQTAWIIVKSLCELAFVIQFLGALERRMRKGSGYAARTVLIVLILIMAYSSGWVGILAILGCVSALFGSKGAAKPMIDKLKNNTDGENR